MHLIYQQNKMRKRKLLPKPTENIKQRGQRKHERQIEELSEKGEV